LCIPFLNQLINHLKQRQHKNLIFLSLFIYSFFFELYLDSMYQ
jgi:hypothetical protein